MSSNGATRRKQDKQSLHYIVRSGIAGGVAGSIAKTVVAPLDRVKILFQASNPDYSKYAGSWTGAFRAGAQIYRDTGIMGLLRGHSATLYRIFPYAAIKFMAYDQIEHILMPTRDQQTNLRRFTAGALAGMTSVFFTYPLDVIRVRMAFNTDTNHRPSFLYAISKIYHESATSAPASASTSTSTTASPASTLFSRFPILKFYRGFTVTIAGMIPYAGTSFLIWGFLRSRFLPPPPPSSKAKEKSHTVADLTIGALSGAISQTASYPFEVIRRRMQVGGLTHPDRWLGWRETVGTIWRVSGWRGFYVGLGVGYLKIVPMTAVSFTAWQWMKRVLEV
ncbi:mitochondrial carrier domain-containing protein [Cristinia sonorae]|uniref:Mitochondrial carrier domain-containing protein n=1 Tax=Cristinia sonorae TaxID=1940300 RepID=A0A8K0XMM9_9AGAR|nr:mitochondrial carrier domain-containing protein [Cristinia sonorae]